MRALRVIAPTSRMKRISRIATECGRSPVARTRLPQKEAHQTCIPRDGPGRCGRFRQDHSAHVTTPRELYRAWKQQLDANRTRGAPGLARSEPAAGARRENGGRATLVGRTAAPKSSKQ